ncbi:MAG: divergent polysaccharide deacetylase family protein [Deltaproteobacteria bacterium]|nr:divergent polysaccharide deacetylase family protein [Deltaproteobacteria bacterium]
MKKKPGPNVPLRRRLLFAGSVGAGVALFFLLGYLLAGRLSRPPLSTDSGPQVTSELENHRAPGRERESLEEGLRQLEERLAACRPPVEVEHHWEVVRHGAHEWRRLGLRGHCLDLAALAQVLDAEKDFFRRELDFRVLIYLDKSRATLNLLILEGEEVVAVGTFVEVGAKAGSDSDVPGPRLAIVIDDLGRSLEQAAEFVALPLPLTFAVFPLLKNSHKVAAYLNDHQRDIILHAPMEPQGYPAVDPGPGALLSCMNADQLSSTLVTDLQSLPGIVGINNHMGSRLTADARKMAQVMQVLKGRRLFFLDSRTIASSVAYKSAVECGVPALQRDIFLDNVKDIGHIREELKALIEVAKVKGSSVAIGHPYEETAAALRLLPEMAREAGVEIVALRELVR